MSFEGKTIRCSDCGIEFTFSAEEREALKSEGFTNEPIRCHRCRQSRKLEGYKDSGRSTYTGSGWKGGRFRLGDTR